MAQIDSSIYFKNRGGPSLADSIKKGFSLGQMIKKNRLQDEDRVKQQNLKDIYRDAFIKDEKGDVSFDYGRLSDIAQYDPRAGVSLLGQRDAKRSAVQKAKKEDERFDYSKTVDERKFGLEKNKLGAQEKKWAEDARIKWAEMKLKNKQKNEEDIYKTLVPGLGRALNADDAKKLKSSKEMKSKFDRQIGELINLRKKYGVEYFNREAVARGKQLSKDLLLTYKNLAKLGVLSKSDEDIVNAIIPGDPLGQDWMPGQDSILHKLNKFKGDLDADYKETIATRLRNPSTASQAVSIEDRVKSYTPEQKAARLQELLNKQKASQGR